MVLPRILKRQRTAFANTWRRPGDQAEVSRVWKSLADVCAKTDDALGEVHALSTMCQLPDLPLYVVSSAANRINSTLHHSGRPLPQDELGVLLRGVIDKLEEREGRFVG